MLYSRSQKLSITYLAHEGGFVTLGRPLVHDLKATKVETWALCVCVYIQNKTRDFILIPLEYDAILISAKTTHNGPQIPKTARIYYICALSHQIDLCGYIEAFRHI